MEFTEIDGIDHKTYSDFLPNVSAVVDENVDQRVDTQTVHVIPGELLPELSRPVDDKESLGEHIESNLVGADRRENNLDDSHLDESIHDIAHNDENVWVQHYEDTYKRYYYLNTVTGEFQWDNPLEDDQRDNESGDEAHVEEAGLEKHPAELYGPEHFYYDEDQANIEEQIELDERAESPRDRAEKGETVQEVTPVYHQYQHDANANKSVHEGDEKEGEELYQEEENPYNFLYENQYHDSTNFENESQLKYDYYCDEEEEDPYYPDEDDEGEGEDEDDEEPDLERGHGGGNPPSITKKKKDILDGVATPKWGKSRSKDYPIGSSGQDYIHMARTYLMQRPYSDPKAKNICVLCRKNYADYVFFPCEHCCCCRTCIETEHICSDADLEFLPDGYCNCSLCATVIKLILPSEGGAEVDAYWNWVYEESVPLPPKFMKNFRHSAGVIQAVYAQNNPSSDSFENASKQLDNCVVS
jgi:hypothetical protein